MTTTLDPAILAFIERIDPPDLGYVDGWVPEPYQTPPPEPWKWWLFMAGRGSGKTDTGAHYVDRYARMNPGCRIAIIAPTLEDGRELCVEGDSGLLNANPEIRFVAPRRILWPNGSRARLYSAKTYEESQRLRGPQHHLVWGDEVASWVHLDATWKQMEFGLRLGSRPHAVFTTTPKPRARLIKLMDDPRCVRTTATTDDNPHLDQHVRDDLYREYGGTRDGRQELLAEMLTDVPGALWTPDGLEAARGRCPSPLPDLIRVVVGVDPQAKKGAAQTGIVVAGKDTKTTGGIIADRSKDGSPNEWATAAVEAYYEFSADCIVAEANNGGEMVEETIRTVDRRVPVKLVHASRGKRTRAEPVSAVFEQGRAWISGMWPELEDQMTTWVPGDESPDQMDAMVWAMTELGLVAARPVRTTPRDLVPDKRRGRPLTAGIREQQW